MSSCTPSCVDRVVVRVLGWIADLTGRLGHRGAFDRFRARRERLTDALWGGWDRSLDAVGARWERLTDKVRARRERLTDALWGGWDRSLDAVGARWERLTDKVARREWLPGKRAEPFRRSLGRRSSAILGTSLCVVVMVMMAVVLLRDQRAPPAPPKAPSVEPSVAVGGVDVPDVRGMPASDARAELEHAGLEFAEPRAALGTPGLVLWTEPGVGRSVPTGTPVTIVIGVEAERLGSASS